VEEEEVEVKEGENSMEESEESRGVVASGSESKLSPLPPEKYPLSPLPLPLLPTPATAAVAASPGVLPEEVVTVPDEDVDPLPAALAAPGS
jgi:hypothetical protein